VRFETVSSFDVDLRRLKREQLRSFKAVTTDFSSACDEFARTPGYRWPSALRVAPMKGTRGIWEMTWSFVSPDGRATFEFVRYGDELVCRWRRIGDHGAFRSPE
jgi:hypothetical protein